MARSALRVLLFAAVVLAAFGVNALAQEGTGEAWPTPDAYVRGWGAITIPFPEAVIRKPNLGFFGINVNQFRDQVYGGFHYREVTPEGKVVAWMYSRIVQKLEVRGNTATILAEGVVNGQRAIISIEALDDLAGDWMRISASGYFLDVVLYNAAGGVSQGNIQIWKRPPPGSLTFGHGAVALPENRIMAGNTLGVFKFDVRNFPSGPVGGLSYTEAAMNRPGVRIFVPQFAVLEVKGNKATMAGNGTINGRPAKVHVEVVDNMDPQSRVPTLIPPVPDEFALRADYLISPQLDMPQPAPYYVKRPLVKGDIVVRDAVSITPLE